MLRLNDLDMKKQRGGQIFNDAVKGLLYVLSVIGDVFVQSGKYVYENNMSILYHLMLIAAYTLCFYYLQFRNSEVFSLISLVILHFILLGTILSIKIKLPVLELGSSIQFATFSVYVLAVGWIFLLAAMGFMLKVYYDLYQAFVVKSSMDIQYGSTRPLFEKLVSALFYGVIFMWTFYVIEYLKTNDVLLLNVIFMVIAMVLLVYAIYWFIQGNILWGSLETVGSFISLAILKTINDSQTDLVGFFTNNQIANSIFLLYGIVYVCVTGYAYQLSCELAEVTQSISIPALIQLNPAYHEHFTVNETINGKTCHFDNSDPQLYHLLSTSASDAVTMKILEEKYCSPTTAPPMTTTAPASVTDKLLELWNIRNPPNTSPPTDAGTTPAVPSSSLPTSIPIITALPIPTHHTAATEPPLPAAETAITIPENILKYVDSIQL